jgi:RNA polymerase sigma factor (sigma-70 family)
VAAVPSIGRATRVERPVAPGADAAGALYERYSAQILGYCLHQLGSREEAEDAVQTTFMNAFRGLSRGVVPELESAWLFKIAHNVCLSRRRSSWRRGKVEAPNNFEVLQEIVPGREQVADELIRLQDVLERMPENQRRAILLREWQGLTYREISDELGLSQAAVETLIFRARRALAQGLEQDADTWKKRLRRGADFGGAIACIQALLGGGGAAAVKVAATALVVGTTALAGATDSPPRQTYRAAAPQPAATAKATQRGSAPTSVSATTFAPSAKKTTASRARSTERSLPRPVAVSPTSVPEPTTGAPAAETVAPPPATENTLPAATPPATATESAPTPPTAPADEKGNGKDKLDRTTQSTQSPAESQPAPTPAVEPLPQPEPTPPGHEHKPDKDKPDKPDKSDKPDHPNNGNGNGNGNK